MNVRSSECVDKKYVCKVFSLSRHNRYKKIAVQRSNLKKSYVCKLYSHILQLASQNHQLPTLMFTVIKLSRIFREILQATQSLVNSI